jgi:4-oxalmesaconate hydratase
MWSRRHDEAFEDTLRKHFYFDTCLYTQESLDLLFRWVGPDRCMFGTEKPGIGTAKDPKTGEWIDDVKKKIDAIEWLTDADRQQVYEGTATKVYKLK